MKKEYKDYFEKWINGVQSELIFWENYMRTEGGDFFYGFEKTVSPNRFFELEEDIPIESYGENYKFIDVGSGPFSRCGFITDLVKLEAVSVDPLAYAYTFLKKKYNLDNGIRLDNGFVELLNMKFESNSFDMVHMSNSLDHCFSAIDGLYQLINICKIGGKIILRHHENEAENSGYMGLHQWNLSLHNDENSFVIWRDKERYDVCKIFSEYVDFQLLPDQLESGKQWIHNKVVMTKKKDIPLPQNNYYSIMLDIIYGKMISDQLRLNSINKMTEYSDQNIKDVRISRIRKAYHTKNNVKDILSYHNVKKVIVYGLGCVGKNLNYLLESLGIEVIKLDIRGSDCGVINAVSMDKCSDWQVDKVISTIDDSKVIQELSTYVLSSETVIKIDSFLDIIEGRKIL